MGTFLHEALLVSIFQADEIKKKFVFNGAYLHPSDILLITDVLINVSHQYGGSWQVCLSKISRVYSHKTCGHKGKVMLCGLQCSDFS